MGARCFAAATRAAVMQRVHRRSLAAPGEAMREILDDRERDRNEDQSKGGREEHATDNDGSENAAGSRTRTGRSPQRQASEDEGQSCHYDRPEAQTRSIQRCLTDTLTALVVHLRELDD